MRQMQLRIPWDVSSDSMDVNPSAPLVSSIQTGRGSFAFLLGSGVSRSAGLPTGREVVKYLVRRLATIEGENPEDDPISWYELRTGNKPDYSELIEMLAPSPAERVQLLKECIEQTSIDQHFYDIEPSPAHDALVELIAQQYVSVVVTTNFDRLIENALTAANLPPVVITNLTTPETTMPITYNRITVIKANGDYLSPDFKNTVEELNTYDEALDQLLDRVFSEYNVVICGWSADWDKALRNALVRSHSNLFSTYWLQKGTLGEEAARVISRRNAVLLRIDDADTALTTLRRDVEALAKTNSSSTLNSESTMVRMKRYIPNDVDQIKLRELLINETEAAISLIKDLEVTRHIREDRPLHIRERMKVYEDAAATLLKLLIVGAQLSDRPGHNRIWAECVRRLVNRDMHLHNGDVDKINLQFYPALLAIYAIALGSAAAGRVESIAHTLAEVTISRPLTEFKQFGAVPVTASMDALHISLFPANVDRSNPRPKSDHLFGVLQTAAAGELPEGAQLEDYFDESEYLLGVAGTAQLQPLLPYWLAPVGRAVVRLSRGNSYPDRLVERHQDVLISKGVFRDLNHVDEARDIYNLEFQQLRQWLNPFWISMHQE